MFRAPFSICCDRSKKVIVLTVKGTLFITDILSEELYSSSMVEMDEEDKDPNNGRNHFVHKVRELKVKLAYLCTPK